MINQLLVILMLCLLYLVIQQKLELYESVQFWKTKNKDVVILLKKHLSEVNAILFQHKEKPFLIGGTLLGAIRDNDIIPWDDDIDIGLVTKDTSLLTKKLLIIFDPAKYFVKPVFFGCKIISILNPSIFIDIFYFHLNDDVYELSFFQARRYWQQEYYHRNQLENLEHQRLGVNSYYVPSNSVSYLHRKYGADCLNIGNITHVHHFSIDWILIYFFKPTINYL